MMKAQKDIPLSVLDLSPIQTGGSATDALHRTRDLAQHVERWGFHRYWVAEHHNMTGIASSATAVVIGYIASATSAIRVGSGGVMLPNHAPLMVAESFGTLASLYPGRIDLGIGRAPGTDPATMRALRRESRSQSRDFPEMLEELIEYIYGSTTHEVSMRPRAIMAENMDIPIWLLGSSDFSAQLAGFLGLPFAHAGQFAPENTEVALRAYRETFRPSSFLSKPYAMLGTNVIAASTDDEAQHLATTTMQKSLQLIRGQISTAQMMPPVPSMEGLWTDEEKRMVGRRLEASIIGGPRTVQEGLVRLWQSTEVDELIINSEIFHHEDRLKSFEIVRDAWRSE